MIQVIAESPKKLQCSVVTHPRVKTPVIRWVRLEPKLDQAI